MPKVSVLMSVRNGERYLVPAVESILDQTFEDFEFLIMNDGSTDSTPTILDRYSDPRIRRFHNQESQGLAKSLNTLIEAANGKYFARMDADDVSFGRRLEKQVEFLDANPTVGVLGTAHVRINSGGKTLGGIAERPHTDPEIRWAVLLENPFAHPTVMIRASVLREHGIRYNESFETTQDFDLWVRLLKVTEGANLSEPLVRYRIHGRMVSARKREIQQTNSVAIAHHSFSVHLPGVKIDHDTIRQLQSILFGGSRLRPPANADRVNLAKVYAGAFESYVSERDRDRRLRLVGRKVSMHLAHLALLPPLLKGWPQIAAKAWSLSPMFPARFAVYFADVFAREIGRRILIPTTSNGDDRTRLLFVIGTLERGGAEMHLSHLMTKIDHSRYAPTVYLLSDRGSLAEKLDQSRVRIISPPNLKWIRRGRIRKVGVYVFIVLSAIKLLTVMFRERPEIAHFFLPAAYIVGGVCGILARVRSMIMSRRSLNNYMDRQPFASTIERWLHPRMDMILANSLAVANQLKNEGVPYSKIGLLYSGVAETPPIYNDHRSVVRDGLGIPENALALVCVANLISYKGHEDLIAALGAVKSDLPANWRLILIGRDDGVQMALESQLKEQALLEHIIWLGERDDVMSICPAMDISVLCSHEEGMPNALLEAMSAGLPVVATAAGGVRDAVVDGETGFVVPVRDREAIGQAIVQLAHDSNLRARMASAGRQRALEHFSLDRATNDYEAVYAMVTANAGVPRFLRLDKQ